jgi:hypothetical protein
MAAYSQGLWPLSKDTFAPGHAENKRLRILLVDDQTSALTADATIGSLLRVVPAALPGIAFLAGGQSSELAPARLNAMKARWARENGGF